jgi:F-box protein 9
VKIVPTAELIASFAHLQIPGAEPIVENTPPPPCPIATVPSEVIVEILRHVALDDPSTFGRMALVCKRMAYHFAHEQQIWRRICQAPEFGFQGMHYDFACDLVGLPIYTLGPRYTPFPKEEAVEIPQPLSSWSQVFQTLPRIRYTGIYISTVNYTRPGATAAYSNVSWNSPIHIVTYYRYLRFYPDGSVISLLTSTEPVDVVPYISKENVMAARTPAQRKHQRNPSDQGQSLSGATEPVPAVAMNTLKHGLRGRWHLASPVDTSETSTETWKPESGSDQKSLLSDERDIVIETEGVDMKYMYTMHLSLRSSTVPKAALAGPAPPNPSKNTKMIWKGFWSYNRLTDDWGEFGLRNDRAFVFRRVRGWGLD